MTRRSAARTPTTATDPVAEFLDVSRSLVGIAVYSVNAAPVDITVTQYRLVAVLGAQGPLTIGEVAELLGVAQSNASRHCDRLERLELLQRARSQDDGRVVIVELTASGRELIDFVTDVRRREVGSVLGSMPSADRKRLIDAARDFNVAAAAQEDRPWLTAAW
ncbi:MAG TPA: MarR family transcriptional regulator [Nocardioides sp.]|uniref:MarR family winged helix-turn-helix transcriptional regulator n=1 Tax=uncultured Nocardioides sp. TaxID=198441 RepID=UPI0026091961|nr:MarR family transcriptional regulator [uncultured Nocardioides sp.]HRD59427.1 MarR family transcriptional regulator [Nocardioides sp.]HRI94685.1 MarR family transcriptional regulator [Nocardioides sp.]HRK47913.1 MarR family transcriptional regulator [Nocardioides sp.]